MNLSMDSALKLLYQREIYERSQLLNEMLRVKLTYRAAQSHSNIMHDKSELFKLMKETTEENLGYFPADRDFFIQLYDTLKDVDEIEFVTEIYKNDRAGTVMPPACLTSFVQEKILKQKPKTILITEAEKHISGLDAIISENASINFTLTTQNHQMDILLKLCFEKYNNVTVIFESIYTELLNDNKYDFIYCLPAFGVKMDEYPQGFFTKDACGIALENMLRHLTENGELCIILPARITFASNLKELRNSIIENHNIDSIYILPDETFRPVTSIKTYMVNISHKQKATLEIGTMTINDMKLVLEDKKTLPRSVFISHEDWRIELLLSDDDENIKQFKESEHEKVKLKECAEVFRGKSILKKDVSIGNIKVLNISNIENGEIDYVHLDTIDEDERKVKRYELCSGDVVLSCRGTAIKTAVFAKQNQIIIASANLLVIRPNEKMLSDYIKIFFESPVGIALIKSFQRGTTVMNINFTDIMEMEIPLLPLEKQRDMADKYTQEFETYKRVVSQAEKQWQSIKDDVYNQFI